MFHPKEMAPFIALWNSLFSIASTTDYIRDMKINGELNNLLVLLMNESWHQPGNEKKSKTKKRNIMPVKRYLDEHYNEKVSLDELAEIFFINKYYLARIFKGQFDMSINSYLNQVRINHAKQMLRFSDEKIENIGLACGFKGANYFSRIFKSSEGITPSEYREKW